MTPLRQGEWRQWFDQQMKLAKKQAEQGLYVSLRLDGRVRASGVGQPPWQILSAQLAPVTGILILNLTCLGYASRAKCLPELRPVKQNVTSIPFTAGPWGGLLDGMDGRV